MKEIASFTTGFLIAMSVAIIMNRPQPGTEIPIPDYGYAEPSYSVEKIIGGWCAGRIIRRAHTYTASYCAGEWGIFPVNIPHSTHPHFYSVFVEMMNEVDSLAGVGR